MRAAGPVRKAKLNIAVLLNAARDSVTLLREGQTFDMCEEVQRL
jgi:hypothetical protein